MLRQNVLKSALILNTRYLWVSYLSLQYIMHNIEKCIQHRYVLYLVLQILIGIVIIVADFKKKVFVVIAWKAAYSQDSRTLRVSIKMYPHRDYITHSGIIAR